MIRDVVVTAAVVALLLTGWLVRGWYEDSRDLAAAEALQRATEEFKQSEQRIAATLEDKLSKVRANERVIEKWRTEIIDRPVYHVECVDDDGLSLINGAATGDTAKPTGEVR